MVFSWILNERFYCVNLYLSSIWTWSAVFCTSFSQDLSMNSSEKPTSSSPLLVPLALSANQMSLFEMWPTADLSQAIRNLQGRDACVVKPQFCVDSTTIQIQHIWLLVRSTTLTTQPPINDKDEVVSIHHSHAYDCSFMGEFISQWF